MGIYLLLRQPPLRSWLPKIPSWRMGELEKYLKNGFRGEHSDKNEVHAFIILVCLCSLAATTASPMHAATEANVEDHLSYQKENRMERIEHIVEKQDITREKVELILDCKGEGSSAHKPPLPERSPPKSPQDRISLKEIKSVENIIQKQKLEHSQNSQPLSPKVIQPGASKLQLSLPGESKQESTGAADIDPKLQLLDTQLRNILKPPRDESQGSSSGSDKDKHKEDHQQMQETAFNSVPETMDGALRGACGVSDGYMVGHNREGFHSERRPAGKITVHMERVSREGEEEEDILIVELPGEEPDDDDRRAAVEHSRPGVMFGGIEEISQTNFYFEDVPTTNVYMDDNATRAAPYTLASQMNASMASSEEEDNTEEEHITRPGSLYRPHSMTSLTHSPYSEPKRKTPQLMKHLQDASEKIGEKLSRRRDLAQEFNWNNVPELSICKESDRTDDGLSSRWTCKDTSLPSTSHKAGRPVLEDSALLYSPQQHKSIKAILLEDIPKPKFSTRSPSSPAKLTSLPKASSPVKAQRLAIGLQDLPTPTPSAPIDWEEKHSAGKVTPKQPEQPWELHSEIFLNGLDTPDSDIKVCQTYDKETFTKDVDIPRIKTESPKVDEVEAVDNDESAGSDTEIQPYHLDKDAVQQKLLALKLEERGMADGESPRQVLGEENNVFDSHNLPNGVAVEKTLEESDLRQAFQQRKLDESLDNRAAHSPLSYHQQIVLQPQLVFRTKVDPDLESHYRESTSSAQQDNLPDGTSETSCQKPLIEKAFVHNKVREFETIANAHSPLRCVRSKDLDSDFDSSSRSLSSSAKAALSNLRDRGRGRHSNRPTRSLCTGASQAEELTVLRASVDVAMLDSLPGSPDMHPKPKPPPGHAPRKAVASSAAR